MNGHVCCILGVCCPPGSEAQITALEAELIADQVCAANPEAKRVAAWILKHFDLAPQGSLDQLRSAFVQHARNAKAE